MAEKPNKTAAKSLKDFSAPPLPFAKHIKEGKSVHTPAAAKSKIEPLIVDDEIAHMIQDMRKKQDEIERALDEVLQKTGWTRRYLKTYLSNPNNFDNESWENLQRQQKDLMSKVKTPKDLRIEKQSQVEGKGSEDQKSNKERRTKTGGIRRNWLPMR